MTDELVEIILSDPSKPVILAKVEPEEAENIKSKAERERESCNIAITDVLEVSIEDTDEQDDRVLQRTALHTAARTGDKEKVNQILIKSRLVTMKVRSQSAKSQEDGWANGKQTPTSGFVKSKARSDPPLIGRVRNGSNASTLPNSMSQQPQKQPEEPTNTEEQQENIPLLYELLTTKDPHGATPLHLAAAWGRSDVARILLEAERDELRSRTAAQYSGNEWRWSSNPQNQGKPPPISPIFSTDNYNHTPLNLAAAEGHVETVKLLLSFGSDVEMVGRKGWSPIHLAAYEGYTEVCRLLLASGANPRRSDVSGCSALEWAINQGHKETAEFFQKCKDQGKNLSIYQACRHGEARVVEECLKYPNWRALDGWTLLHCAAYYGHTEVIKVLLSNGLHVDARNNDGRTPLHEACYAGHTAAILLLLGAEADRFARDKAGVTPMEDLERSGYANRLDENNPRCDSDMKTVAFNRCRLVGTMESCSCFPFAQRQSIIHELDRGLRSFEFPFISDRDYTLNNLGSLSSTSSSPVLSTVNASASNSDSKLTARASAPFSIEACYAALNVCGPIAICESNPSTTGLKEWLKVISRWSGDHSNHLPIVIYLNSRTEASSTISDLNILLPELFGSSLFTPVSLQNSSKQRATLFNNKNTSKIGYWEEQQTGDSPLKPVHAHWPLFHEMRGKVLVVLTGDLGTRELYRCAKGYSPSVCVTERGFVLLAHQIRNEIWVWAGRYKYEGSNNHQKQENSQAQSAAKSEEQNDNIIWDHCSFAGYGVNPVVHCNSDGDIMVVYEEASKSKSGGVKPKRSASISNMSPMNSPSLSSSSSSRQPTSRPRFSTSMSVDSTYTLTDLLSSSSSQTEPEDDYYDEDNEESSSASLSPSVSPAPAQKTSKSQTPSGRLCYSSGCLIIASTGSLPLTDSEECKKNIRIHWRSRGVRYDKGYKPCITVFENRRIFEAHLSEVSSRRTKFFYRVGDLNWETGRVQWINRAIGVVGDLVPTKSVDCSKFLKKGEKIGSLFLSIHDTHKVVVNLAIIEKGGSVCPSISFITTLLPTSTPSNKAMDLEWKEYVPETTPSSPPQVSHATPAKRQVEVLSVPVSKNLISTNKTNWSFPKTKSNEASTPSVVPSPSPSLPKDIVSLASTSSNAQIGIPKNKKFENEEVEGKLLYAAWSSSTQTIRWKPVQLVQLMFVECLSMSEDLFFDAGNVFFGVHHDDIPEKILDPELLRGRVLRVWGHYFSNASRLPQHASSVLWPNIISSVDDPEARQFKRYCAMIGAGLESDFP